MSLLLSLGLYIYHYVGSVLSEAIGRSLTAAHIPFTESRELSANSRFPVLLFYLYVPCGSFSAACCAESWLRLGDDLAPASE